MNSLSAAILRAQVLSQIRLFFAKHNVLEVETPILSHAGSTDCHIDLFSSFFYPTGVPSNLRDKTVYLQTSPELHMKQLLAAGYPDIFQICKVFRNGENGAKHNPEFTMLEWYRLNFSMHQLIDEVAEICLFLMGEKPVVKTSYQTLFIETTSIDPLETNLATLRGWCKKNNLYPPDSFNSTTDLLQFIMAEKIEPILPKETLFFVYDFPVEQAVLAAINTQDPRIASRFELYCNSMELCNGFQECGDKTENEKRMNEENIKRGISKKAIIPINNNFLNALGTGFPPCSGVAVGIDRILMQIANTASITEVLTFPWDDA